MHPLSYDYPLKHPLSTDTLAFYHDNVEALDHQQSDGTLAFYHDNVDTLDHQHSDGGCPPGIERLFPLAAGYETTWPDPAQQRFPHSAETPEGLLYTQDADLALQQQVPDASITLRVQEPSDNIL